MYLRKSRIYLWKGKGGVWGRGVGRGGRGKVSENTAGRVSGAQGGWVGGGQYGVKYDVEYKEGGGGGRGGGGVQAVQ